MKIPFFNYQYLFKSREEKFIEIIKDIGNRGAYILQKDLEEFEENLAKYIGVKYALGVANGTDVIYRTHPCGMSRSRRFLNRTLSSRWRHDFTLC